MSDFDRSAGLTCAPDWKTFETEDWWRIANRCKSPRKLPYRPLDFHYPAHSTSLRCYEHHMVESLYIISVKIKLQHFLALKTHAFDL
jgi:hypothetical protein